MSTTQIYARVVESKISEDINNELERFKEKRSSELPRGKPTRHRLENDFDFKAILGAFKSRLSSKTLVLACSKKTTGTVVSNPRRWY